jgi:hypothetical protein
LFPPQHHDYKASSRCLLSGVAVTLTFVCVAMCQQRRIALGFVKPEQPRYDLGNDLRDRVRRTMAQRDPSTSASAPVILHYGGTVLPAPTEAAFGSYPKRKFWR